MIVDLTDTENLELYNLVSEYLSMLKDIVIQYKDSPLKPLVDLKKRTENKIEVFKSIKLKLHFPE